MSKPGNKVFQEIPLEIVGSTKFGRYPKISVEQTWNMIISDGWLVPFAGYRKVQVISSNGQGRGIFASDKLNKMFVVIDDSVFYEDQNLSRTFVGKINTFVGEVYIAGNNAGEVAFSDGQDIWIYNNTTSAFTKAVIDFTPGYISFQNTRFLSANTASFQWRLSASNNGLSWPNDAQHVGELETKPDLAQAVIPVPSKANLAFVFGKTVGEPWYDVGNPLFPYQKSTSSNLDYGLASVPTLAAGDKFVIFLGKNEKSGYAIMYSEGGQAMQLSNDGINYQLSHLTNPELSFGFLFKQDGHVIYVITFPDDNLSYIYDFETKAFFNISDKDMNYHIAKRVAFFHGRYYFVSFIDGDLYELNSNIYTGDDEEIPRVRICKHIRSADQSRYVLANIGFTVEQGEIPFNDINTEFTLATEDFVDITTENGINIGGGYNFSNNIPRIDLSLSKDGGMNFGSQYPKFLNSLGHRKNRLWWLQLGEGNDLVPQFRFWAKGRFVATNGIASIYQ